MGHPIRDVGKVLERIHNSRKRGKVQVSHGFPKDVTLKRGSNIESLGGDRYGK
jgi:hypothetical protein